MHKKSPSQVIGKGLSECALIVSLYRASIPLSLICFLTASYMGTFFPAEDTGNQGSPSTSGLFKYLGEVFCCACIAGSDNRDGDYTSVLFAK